MKKKEGEEEEKLLVNEGSSFVIQTQLYIARLLSSAISALILEFPQPKNNEEIHFCSLLTIRAVIFMDNSPNGLRRDFNRKSNLKAEQSYKH